jgi:hypothetical protein
LPVYLEEEWHVEILAWVQVGVRCLLVASNNSGNPGFSLGALAKLEENHKRRGHGVGESLFLFNKTKCVVRLSILVRRSVGRELVSRGAGTVQQQETLINAIKTRILDENDPIRG